MKRRILCLLLLACMLISAVPTFLLPSTAAEAGETAAADGKITVSFRAGDSRVAGVNGAVVAERRVAVGFSSFALPSDAECYAAGVKPDQVLGWYYTDLKGTVIDARAYLGTYLSEDLVFYPILKSSTFDLLGNSNVPYFTKDITHTEDSTRYYTLLGLRGGFNAGYVEANTVFHGFDRVPSSWLATAPSGTTVDPWSLGGAYYSAYTATSDNAFVLSSNANRVVGINWTAIASGRVDLDFSQLTFLNGGQGTATVAEPTVYLALVKDGDVVWPQDASFATKNFAANGWYEASTVTDGTAGRYSITLDGAVLNDLAVTGGDSFTLCFGYSNIKPLNVRFTATYKEVGEFSEDIVTALPAYTVPSVFSPAQVPTVTAPSDTEPEVSVDGLWDWITYPSYADIAKGNTDEIAYYSPSGQTKNAFLTSIKDYGSDSAVPAGFKFGLPDYSWGAKYSIALQNNGELVGTAGFRYTAEHTGRVDLSFASFVRSPLGWDQKENNIRIAIFLDGVMVWPQAGADATKLTNWYTPYPDGVSNGEASKKNEDIAEALNALLPQDLFVTAGQKIEFLMTAAPNTNIWGGAGNYMEPTVSYSVAYITDFKISAALGERFALKFSASTETGAFVPSDARAYLLADTLALSVSGASAEMKVGAQKNADGTVSVTVEDIAARMLSDKVTYTLTATERAPSGKTAKITLQSGELSLADYFATLAAKGGTAVADLANATLAYGRAAQLYFNYNTENLPNAGALTFTPEATRDISAQSEGGGVRFSAASLLLQDTLKIKLYINAAQAPAGALFLATEGSDERIPLIAAKDGTYRAHFPVYAADFATAYTFSVVDGEGKTLSSTLTYSVASYAARMQNEDGLTELLSAVTALGEAAEKYELLTQPTPRGNTVSRVIILSDVHIGETLTGANAKLEATLGKIVEMGGADAILFLGDMTDSGSDNQYDALVRILQDERFAGATERVGFVLGNHEHYRAGYKTTANTAEEKAAVTAAFNQKLGAFHSEALGFSTANGGLDHTLILDGTYYIGLGERDCVGLYGSEVEEYLKKQVAAAADANPNKPIFVYSHIGYGEIMGESQMKISAETAAFLANYPQVIWLTGHTHYASQDPYMIQQKDFTNIQSPTLGSKWWWYYSSYDSANYAHPSEYAYEAQQGILLEVTDTNVVIAQRYDFGLGEPVGQEWVIDTPAIVRSTENFTYTVDGRLDEAEAPVWKKSDALTFSSATANSVTVTLPRAHIDDAVSDDAVTYYRLVAVDSEGNVVYTGRIMSEFYRGSAQADTYSFKITGLEANTEYRVMAVAESVFGMLSVALEGEFTTAAG